MPLQTTRAPKVTARAGEVIARSGILDNPYLSALRGFNSVLTAACVLDELEVGVSCMGVIEQAFARISALIGAAVVKRGWVKAEELVHYKLHAQVDERHAEEFFAVVEPHWEDEE